MDWKVVKIRTNKTREGKPSASVGIGRISLNSVACDLIDGFEKYTHAIFMEARKDNKICIGIKFLTEKKENSIKINKRKYNGEVVKNSCNFNNKTLAKDLFGIQGTNKTLKAYDVALDEEDKNILVIYLA